VRGGSREIEPAASSAGTERVRKPGNKYARNKYEKRSSLGSFAEAQQQEARVRKDLLRRLEKLEMSKKARDERFDSIGLLCRTFAEGMDRALAANEQFVADWYVEPNGRICEVRLRITADPSDRGRNYGRDVAGKHAENPKLERRLTESGPKGIIWVSTIAGSVPFPTRIGTRMIKYV
jgi:hypothetical protein